MGRNNIVAIIFILAHHVDLLLRLLLHDSLGLKLQYQK